MRNFKLVKTAAAFALGASVITSVVVVPDASAASKYKVKGGNLVVSKTGKAAKGIITFKKIVYKNGKKLTGLKGNIYYKAGKKATGTYKGTYYVKGAAKVKTGTYNKSYYVKGKKVVSTGLYKAQYYKDGKKATGTYKGAYYLNGAKKVTTGYYNNAHYVNGKKVVSTGVYKETYYVKGKVSTGLALYQKVLYKNGKLNTGLVVFNAQLYDGSILNKGEKLFEEKLYVDGNVNKGFKVFDGKLYNGAALNIGVKLFEAKLYDGAALNKGLKLFEAKLYEDAELSKGIKEFEAKFYNDGILAEGTFIVGGKDEAFEAGLKVKVKVASAQVNENEIVIKFNKAIDKKTAEAVTSATDKTATLLNIGNATVTNPKLSEDGRTLTAEYTFTNNVKEFTNAVLTVQAVATKADAKEVAPKFVQIINFKDTVAPTVKSVLSETNGSIASTATVKLSEAVKPGAVVKINGDYVTVKPFTGTSDELELTGLRLEVGKTHTVEVLNLEDKIGNKTVTSSATFTVAVDSGIPVVAAKAGESDRDIILTFTKSMKGDTLAGIVVRDESLGLVNLVGNTFTVVPGTNNTQYKGTVNIFEQYKNKNTRDFTVVVPRNLEDRLGNRTDETLNKVTLVKDSSAPTIVSSQAVKNLTGQITSIELNFSEGLSAGALGTAGKNSLNDIATSVVTSNGVLDRSTFKDFIAVPIKAGDKKVVFEWKPATVVAAPVINGQFTFTFGKGLVKDESATANESAAFNHTINFATQAASTEFNLVAGTNFVSSNNEIKVDFTESVRGGGVAGSATDLANYTLNGKPLPAGTFIYLSAETATNKQQQAVIRLPKGSIDKTDKFAILTVANIQNLAGNKTIKTESRYTEVKDNIDPKLTSARILADGKTVEIVYNEAVKVPVNTEIKGAFSFTVNGILTNLTNLNVTSVNGNTIIAKINTSVTTTTPAILATEASFYDTKGAVYKAVAKDKIVKGDVTYTYFNDKDVVVPAADGKETIYANGNGFYDTKGVAYKALAKDTIVKATQTYTYFNIGDEVVKAVDNTNIEAGLDISKALTIESLKGNTLITDLEGNNQEANIKLTILR